MEAEKTSFRWSFKLALTAFALGCCSTSQAAPHPQDPNQTRKLRVGDSFHYIEIFKYPQLLPAASLKVSLFAKAAKREMFLLTDRNTDNGLTFAEWDRQYERIRDPAETPSATAFAEQDANHDGLITLAEYPLPAMHRYLPYHATYVDIDDDGFISASECSAVWDATGPALLETHTRVGRDCRLADTNGDEKVSVAEYHECCGMPKRRLMWFEEKPQQHRVAPPRPVSVDQQ